jgi:hypothetical protein
MNFRKLIGKLFKGTKEPEAQAMEAALTTLQEGPQPTPIRMRPRRLWHDKQFLDPRMTRGVQMAMERKHRPARLEFIWRSVRQGNMIREAFRAAQLKARELRAAAL